MVADLSNFSITKGAVLANPKLVSFHWAKTAFSSYQLFFDRSQPFYFTEEAGIILEKNDDMSFSCIANGVFCVNWSHSKVSLRIYVRGHRAIVQLVLRSTKTSFNNHEISTGNAIPSPLISFIKLVDPSNDHESELNENTTQAQDELDEEFDSDFEIMFSHNSECFVGSYRPSWVSQGLVAY